MSEFFVWSNSFAAPFVSDTDTSFVEAESAEAALTKAQAEYTHPCGLYAMNVYASSDDFHKGKDAAAMYRHPLAEAQSNGVPCGQCGKQARLSMTTPDGEMHFTCGDHETVKQRSEFVKAA